ncbi:hypothetical protein GF367_02460 [Candidatus Woesearchaeota archaeon]|nr:hypothetical protein [Candidatus Woesearchaeota archaeon]
MGRKRIDRMMGRMSPREKKMMDRDGARDKQGAVLRVVFAFILLALLIFFLLPYFLR